MEGLTTRLTRRARRCALGADGSGRIHVATVVAGRHGCHLRVAPLDRRAGEHPHVLGVDAGAILDVCLAADDVGRLVAFWNQATPDGAKLYFAIDRGVADWTAPAPVAPLFGSVINPAAVRDKCGRIWVVFQCNAVGRQHIFATWLHGGHWAFPQRISDGDGHCFAPALCRFGDGARVVWDGRIDGEYGIYMRELDTGPDLSEWEPQGTVAESETLLANPTVVALDHERSVIVYERAQPEWGQRNQVLHGGDLSQSGGNYLRGRRELCGVMVGPEGQADFVLELDEALSVGQPWPSRSAPALGMDGEGTIWLAYRQLAPPDEVDPEEGFVQVVTRYADGGWTPPVVLPDSGACTDALAVLWLDADGRLLVSYSQRRQLRWTSRVAVLPAANPAELPAELPADRPETKQFEAMTLSEFDGPEEPHRVTVAGEYDSPELLWGELHRHSELSACCWWLEGSPADAYRYALTAAELDFFALTDHAWYLDSPDAAADALDLANAYNLPGVFTAFCAYEANYTGGEGHMVVLTDKADAAASVDKKRSTTIKRLDPTHVVAIPHHTGDPQHPYCWDGHDEILGPVAEIYQPYRGGFESNEAPAPPTPWRLAGHEIVDECSLQAAWRAGHRIGVVASCDHLATGGALTGVWADGNSRRDILNALRERRCYGATDKIELAFWADDHFMGADFAATVPKGKDAAKATFKVRCRGAGSIREIELLADGEVVHVFTPPAGKKSRKLTARKKLPVPAGEHFYTVRVHQVDGNMAWSSPVWISV